MSARTKSSSWRVVRHSYASQKYSYHDLALFDNLPAPRRSPPCVPILISAPGIAWVPAYTIAAEIADIDRFPTPKKLTGYTGLCTGVYQSGLADRRGPRQPSPNRERGRRHTKDQRPHDPL